jgi:hypothetical protein
MDSKKSFFNDGYPNPGKRREWAIRIRHAWHIKKRQSSQAHRVASTGPAFFPHRFSGDLKQKSLFQGSF